MFLAGCRDENTTPAAVRTARVVVVTPHQLGVVAEGAGLIRSRYDSPVGFEVGGRVVSRYVDVGAVVTKGQKLAKLSDVDYQNRVTAAEGELATANAAVAQATPQEWRYRTLLEKGWTTRALYENALKALQSAQAQVQSADANLRIAQNQLSYTELLAPDDGVVTATKADPGQVVEAGQAIVEIAKNAEHEAVFAVASEHIAHAKVGMPVKVSLQGRPEIAVTGSIREISPEADSTTGTYQVKVTLPSPPLLEMRLGAVVVGRVEIQGQEVVSLPPTALLQSGDGPQVWVVGEDGKVHRRPVELLEFDANSVVISRGLSPGEKVVTAGINSLAEGESVKPETEGNSMAGVEVPEAPDGGRVMSRFNLSEWAVNNKSLVVFLMLLCVVGGIGAYERLGRQEDPDFSVQTMVVQVSWPGATAIDTLNQVTDRLEKKLEETPNLDYLKSYTKPGQATVFVYLKELTPKAEIQDIWYQVRKKVSDIKATLPKDVVGPFFNDEFGDVFGIIYGITYDGFTPREARDFAETVRTEFLRSPDVGKVEIFGDQDEKIYLNLSPQKLANLKLDLDAVLTAIAKQNAVVPSGVINTPSENVLVDVTGALLTPEAIAKLNLWVDGRFYKLTDIAEIQHGYSDPATKMFRVNGKPAIGIGVNMRAGGNNLTFGEGLHEAAERLMQRLPVGIELKLVSDQPEVVREAIGGFTEALFEAIAIVLAVSFLSLGLRAGLVVAISIPLVLAIVFLGMEGMGLSLQRISLGALIIALGLLVDDAMITIEMMVSKIEEGMDKVKAATFAYTSTAFSMLTGTLVTIFGFLPIGLAANNTGQYCFSLFTVVAMALIASWFVAVIFAPVIGLTVLPSHIKAHNPAEPGRFMRAFGRTLDWAMRHRWLTIVASLVAFGASVYGLGFVQQQFFPASNRPELLVTMTLPKNASIAATEAQTERLEKVLAGSPDILRFSSNVGGGAIRFYLPLDVQLDNDFLAETVIVAKDLEARDRVQTMLQQRLSHDFPDVTARVSRLELGPPVGWPVQYRVSAPTTDEARHYAEQVMDVLRGSGLVRNVNYDWAERNKELRIVVDQDRVRQAGLSSEQLANALNRVISGSTVTQVARLNLSRRCRGAGPTRRAVDHRSLDQSPDHDADRRLRCLCASSRLSSTSSMRVTCGAAAACPPLPCRRSRCPGSEPSLVNERITAALETVRASMPAGTVLEVGGTVEKSDQSNAAILAQVPLMIALMLTALMVQLGNFRQLALVISVAPLGLIGVVAALLVTGTPMGFIAILGSIALAGMIIRNSVILVHQIEHERAQGVDPWEAVIDATKHRFRPIMLTAAAAILGMIPIMHDVFWGPMAYAIVGGLAVATVLTLVFLPALYVAVNGIREKAEPAAEPDVLTLPILAIQH